MNQTTVAPRHVRADLRRIASWIEPKSRVLDLGCGDGTLLAYLQTNKKVVGAGVELNDEHFIASVRRGVSVIQQDLEEGLALFDDQQFDTVVLSQTLQSMRHTEHILREMARVARFGIVSFPNFGYWPHGWSILRGRMPVTGEMPNLQLRITHLATFNGNKEVKLLPSWRSTLAVYRFESPN